jgi:hypothetical protein
MGPGMFDGLYEWQMQAEKLAEQLKLIAEGDLFYTDKLQAQQALKAFEKFKKEVK